MTPQETGGGPCGMRLNAALSAGQGWNELTRVAQVTGDGAGADYAITNVPTCSAQIQHSMLGRPSRSRMLPSAASSGQAVGLPDLGGR
jgi:hypothetical protein